jgi:hypothetical protein
MGAAAEIVVLRHLSQINDPLSGKVFSGLPSFERFISDAVRQLGDHLLGNHSRLGRVYYLIDQLAKPGLAETQNVGPSDRKMRRIEGPSTSHPFHLKNRSSVSFRQPMTQRPS